MTEQSKRKAYDAGKQAKAEGKPVRSNNGWGYPQGRYYYWFCLGWNGKRYEAKDSDSRYGQMRSAGTGQIPDAYAEAKARKLIAAEFRRNGQENHARQYEHGGFTTAPLRALSRYIAERE